MKRVLKVIQMVLTCIVLTGLYAFTNYRNERRMVTEIDLKFIGNDNLYTTYEAVNKMLIVKQKGAFKAPKDKVALSTIEQWLIEDPMLQNATVYMTVDGALRALLTQRTPEARVVTDSVYYLDTRGKAMPLSEFHSARVPVISGNLSELSLLDCHKIIEFVSQDVFLKKNIVGIRVRKDQDYVLQCRLDQFEVHLGAATALQEKTSNFKAFYNKALNDNSLQSYSLVDVRFKNQVVATKK